jgi:hypothetical protein
LLWIGCGEAAANAKTAMFLWKEKKKEAII